MQLTQNAWKRVGASHKWFWFYFWLDEKVAWVFLLQACSVVNKNLLLFDTQMKTELESVFLSSGVKPKPNQLLTSWNTQPISDCSKAKTKPREIALPIRGLFNWVSQNQNQKRLSWPITKDTHNLFNRSKLRANACSWRTARENMCKLVTIGFGFPSNWMTKWWRLFNPIS